MDKTQLSDSLQE